jgi:hypothetical protein
VAASPRATGPPVLCARACAFVCLTVRGGRLAAPAKFDPHYELMPELLAVPPFPTMPSGLPRLRYPLDQPLPEPGFALEENDDPAEPDERAPL